MAEQSAVEQNLRVCEVLLTSLLAGGRDEAVAVVRADLEVLSREQLLVVAVGLAVKPFHERLLQPAVVAAFARRLEQHRLRVMWAGS